jgi:hypothetical protein
MTQEGKSKIFKLNRSILEKWSSNFKFFLKNLLF